MSKTTSVELDFGDGRYLFKPTLPLSIEFENKHGSLAALEWRLRGGIGVDDKGAATFVGGGDEAVMLRACLDVLRLWLVGGGGGEAGGERVEVGPQRARELVELYAFPARPAGETAAIAWRVLAAAVWGNDVGTSEPETADV